MSTGDPPTGHAIDAMAKKYRDELSKKMAELHTPTSDETIDLGPSAKRMAQSFTLPTPSAGGVTMSMKEVGTTSDPLRRIDWPLEGLPRGTKVWSQLDPLKLVHHVTMEYQGAQAHVEVTEQLMVGADINALAVEVLEDLTKQLGIDLNTEKKYAAIPLSYWKHIIDTAFTEFQTSHEENAKTLEVTNVAYKYIANAKDDLGGTELQKMKRGDYAKRMETIVPSSLTWYVKDIEAGPRVAITIK